MKMELDQGIKELSELIQKNNLVIFAGSGVSVDSGLPSWDNLLLNFMEMAKDLPLSSRDKKDLTELIDDAQKQHNENKFDPIKVATVIKDKIRGCNLNEYPLASAKYQYWLSSVFMNKKPNSNHDLIVQTNYPCILTSNYDLLFEEAANNNNFQDLAERTYSYTDELKIMSSIYSSTPCVIHVHGSIVNLSIDQIIFTKDDYNKLILKKYNGFAFALRMIFTRYSTLFVGYGASDPHLEEVMEEIADYFPLHGEDKHPLPYSYLVVLRSKAGAILEKWKNRVRTNLILIDDYSQYNQLLSTLKNLKPRN
ncbi:SIR2 family protein [Rhabdobacter roseus]|uniref:SIR2-like domain-containing protein n=1 Tax=Rhabdobacter roseus TaxID=1655419 RepID=A0A840TPD3_9BACT|nr:SIR2 family protein [Rhabdobacter roseus]MBB5281910.1 hypothetical protein [Rhabdobacter roseus]